MFKQKIERFLGMLYLLVLYLFMYTYSILPNFWVIPRPDSPPGKKKPSISFAGGAFLYPYYVGVLEYLIENYELEDTTFIAVSSACYPIVC